jgi:hypothetical protein
MLLEAAGEEAPYVATAVGHPELSPALSPSVSELAVVLGAVVACFDGAPMRFSACEIACDYGATGKHDAASSLGLPV